MTQWLADFLDVFNDVNKTFLMLVLLVLATVFRVKGFIDGPAFVDLLKTTTISFFGTTTVLNFTSMIKDHLAAKITPAVVAEVEKKVTNE